MSEVKRKDAPTAIDLVAEWDVAKKALDNAKKTELELRERIVAERFQSNDVGIFHYTTEDACDLVCVKKLNYKLDKAATIIAQDTIAAIIGDELTGRLVNWKPELSISEYKKLPDEARAVIDTALTITPATPTLELKVAK